MSRLIVKNLPNGINEARLKQLFSQKGLVTDVRLKHTKDGKFRGFGFVGFKTDGEAETAREYFDKSYIDTTRISVETCLDLGQSSKPKSKAKLTPEESPKKDVRDEKKKLKKSKKQKEGDEPPDEVKEALAKHKDDPLFNEFLESHLKGQQKGLWGNEDALSSLISSKEITNNEDEAEEHSETKEEEEESDKEDDKERIAEKKISDLQYMEALKKKKGEKQSMENSHGPQKFFTVKVRGLGCNHKKKHIKQFFHPLKAKSIRVPQKIKGIAYVGFKNERQMKQALNKHKSFLEGKRLLVSRYEEKEKDGKGDKSEGKGGEKEMKVRWKEQEEALKSEECIAESGRIFLRNLTYTTTEDDIRKIFEKYGPLTEVNLPIDSITRKPKGFGLVTFLMPEHAVKAYTELDGTALNGRMLHLLPGKAKASIAETFAQDGLTYKQKKDLEKKATANSSHNWNTLFLGQNAVAEAIASAYNTTKEKVLEDASKGMSAAVRLALGETQLVQDTKKFLEDSGVRLEAFDESPEKRSKTVILAKNLPADTRTEEIREMFARHGALGRVVMPPSGVTALVEFLEPFEARKAFMKLAYTKFKHLPLYLEWAPDNSFTSGRGKSERVVQNSSKKRENESKVIVEKESAEKIEDIGEEKSKDKGEEEEEEEEEEAEPETTLFVKNLHFSTTEKQLKEYFEKCGKLSYATVATKKDPKTPGGKLSMGYGFVRYLRKSDADRALKELQMTTLDGKTLELKRSERTLQSDVVSSKKKISKPTSKASTKILVRNIPFQANVNEVTELFKAFGDLKAVRLPKKLVGVEKHRGFAFVEYYTKSDAKRAFKALCQSTHLYGRRLVLEWAEAEEGIDEIRKRTAKHFHQEGAAKKSKKAILDPESVGLE